MFGMVPVEADQPDQFSVVFGNLTVLSPIAHKIEGTGDQKDRSTF
jgi:hypothetical protein